MIVNITGKILTKNASLYPLVLPLNSFLSSNLLSSAEIDRGEAFCFLLSASTRSFSLLPSSSSSESTSSSSDILGVFSVALLGTQETLRVEDFGLGVVDVVKILMGLLLLPKRRLFVVVDTVVVLVVVVVVVVVVIVIVVVEAVVVVVGAVVVMVVNGLVLVVVLVDAEAANVVDAVDVCFVVGMVDVLKA